MKSGPESVSFPSARHHGFAPTNASGANPLEAAGFSAEVDSRNERMSQKIRTAQMQKVPYMLVVGDREMEAGAGAARQRDGTDLGAMPLDEFMTRLAEESQVPKGSAGSAS